MGLIMRNRLIAETADGITKKFAEILSGHVFLAIVYNTGQHTEVVNLCRTPKECALPEKIVVVAYRISGGIG